MSESKPPTNIASGRLFAFKASMGVAAFGIGSKLQLVPEVHRLGDPEPIPRAGCTIPTETPVGLVDVQVVASEVNAMTIEAKGQRWKVALLQADETEPSMSGSETFGATGWIVVDKG